MTCEHDSIRDFIKTIPIYLTNESFLIDAIKLSERYNLGNICIVDENLWPIGCFNRLKLAQIKTLNQRELKTKKIKDIFQDFSCPIITYSHMKKYEVIDIMYQFKLSCLPVARAPWDKKLLGFVFLSDIIPSVKKSV